MPISNPGNVNYVGECGYESGYAYLCNECEGDCDYDDDCEGALICFFRDEFESVLGCSGEGGPLDVSGKDICYDPLSTSPSSSSGPSSTTSMAPSY